MVERESVVETAVVVVGLVRVEIVVYVDVEYRVMVVESWTVVVYGILVVFVTVDNDTNVVVVGLVNVETVVKIEVL